MKIPSKRIELDELGYTGYWIEMPKSVKEGFIQSFAAETQGADTDEAKAAAGRRANVKILELVTAWNLTDDDDKVLPLAKDIKSDKGKIDLLADMPVDILVHLAQNLTGGTNVGAVPENVRDFSKTS